jgi:hypothetical protein
MPCACKEQGGQAPQEVWTKSDEDWLRQAEALRHAALSLAIRPGYDARSSREIVAAAEDFYSFLTGESEVNTADKLGRDCGHSRR